MNELLETRLRAIGSRLGECSITVDCDIYGRLEYKARVTLSAAKETIAASVASGQGGSVDMALNTLLANVAKHFEKEAEQYSAARSLLFGEAAE